MRYKKTLIKIVVFLLFYHPVKSQTNNSQLVETASSFISKFLKDSLNYQQLAMLDCGDVKILQMVLEFKVDAKQHVYDADIKIDTLKKLTSIFTTTLKLSTGKWDKKFIKHYHDKLIFQPILYLVYCTDKKIINKTSKDTSTILSDRDLEHIFRDHLGYMIANFSDLFGTKKECREIKNLLIFPPITVDGQTSPPLKK